jgi:hypothetical protein
MPLLVALFGARSKDWPPEVMDAQDGARIRRDIGRLDEVRLGLGEQVIDYICPWWERQCSPDDGRGEGRSLKSAQRRQSFFVG